MCFTSTEQTKNYQGGNKNSQQDYSDQRMYETSTPLNPVAAYELYVEKRNKDCEAFFQTPLTIFNLEQKSWFRREAMGKNTLGTIMNRISNKAGLSQIYTCHSVRASTITILGHAGVESRLICGITKHKNESSLKHYVDEMSNEQKLKCTTTLSKALEPFSMMPPNDDPPAINLPNDDPPNSDDSNPSAAAANVTASTLADGSLAITIPLEQPHVPTTVPTTTQLWPQPAPPTAPNELKCLQNLLPQCRFDGCTININTMGQTQSHKNI